MKDQVQLVIYSPDAQECLSLRRVLPSHGNLIVAQGSGAQITSQYELDAIFVTGMHITYWGLQPFHSSGARVMSTPKDKRALGMPRLFVAGMLVKHLDSATYGERYASLLLEAVDTYNKANMEAPILRIGSIPDFLGLKGEHVKTAADALISIFRDRSTQSEPVALATKRYA